MSDDNSPKELNKRRVNEFIHHNSGKVKAQIDARHRRLDEFAGNTPSPAASPAEHHISAKDRERQRRHLGPCCRFGEGDGSFWDRWLIAAPPHKSPTLGKGSILPARGFKSVTPKRFHIPRELVQEAERRRRRHQEPTLAQLVAAEKAIRIMGHASANSKAAPRTVKPSGAESEQSSSQRSTGSAAATDLPPLPQDTDSLDSLTSAQARQTLEPQTDKAKAAIARFERMVDASIVDLTSQCKLPENQP